MIYTFHTFTHLLGKIYEQAGELYVDIYKNALFCKHVTECEDGAGGGEGI